MLTIPTRIAVIGSTPEQLPGTAADARYRGYEDAMRAAGLEPDPELLAFGWFSLDGGERAMRRIDNRTYYDWENTWKKNQDL